MPLKGSDACFRAIVYRMENNLSYRFARTAQMFPRQPSCVARSPPRSLNHALFPLYLFNITTLPASCTTLSPHLRLSSSSTTPVLHAPSLNVPTHACITGAVGSKLHGRREREAIRAAAARGDADAGRRRVPFQRALREDLVSSACHLRHGPRHNREGAPSLASSRMCQASSQLPSFFLLSPKPVLRISCHPVVLVL